MKVVCKGALPRGKGPVIIEEMLYKMVNKGDIIECDEVTSNLLNEKYAGCFSVVEEKKELKKASDKMLSKDKSDIKDFM